MLISKLSHGITRGTELIPNASFATLIHQPVGARSPSPCTRLSDGTAVWVARYDVSIRKPTLYCPTHHPKFYDPGAFG